MPLSFIIMLKSTRKEVNGMEIEETGMYCLNSTRGIESDDTGKGRATIIVRLDNFELSAEQAVKIKEIHERTTEAVKSVLSQ